jgi:sRNA-binding carbon storage regulator CsrA
MLVLERTAGQTIDVDCACGNTITIMIVQTRSGGVVRVGIEAPLSCSILRDDAKCKVPKKPRAASDQ